ncbi:MAG: acyl carrier protein [Candidatus Sulfotelmatobacter sp.]
MVFDQIREIASDLFAVPAKNITADSSPESIETWDSAKHLDLVLAIEEKFHIRLSPEETEQMKNIGQIAKIVEGKLSATPG